eukprot:3935852-Rhodomonas_salina.1
MLQAAFGEDACMPAQQLGLIKRSIQRSAGGVNTPEGLAHMLAGMGGRCFLRAAQGADLLELLKGQGDRDDRCFHVSCDRSIDRWKVMHTRHGMGYCYHGCNMLWSERAVKKDCGDLRSPREIRELPNCRNSLPLYCAVSTPVRGTRRDEPCIISLLRSLSSSAGGRHGCGEGQGGARAGIAGAGNGVWLSRLKRCRQRCVALQVEAVQATVEALSTCPHPRHGHDRPTSNVPVWTRV